MIKNDKYGRVNLDRKATAGRSMNMKDRYLFGELSNGAKFLSILSFIVGMIFVGISLYKAVLMESSLPSIVNQTPDSYYYVDKACDKDFEDVSQVSFQGNFKKTGSKYVRTGYNGDTIWIKLNISKVGASEANGGSMTIFATMTTLSEFDVFFPISGAGVSYRSVIANDDSDLFKAYSQDPYSSVVIPKDCDVERPVYVKINTPTPSFSINTASLEEMISVQNHVMSYYVVSMGAIVSMLILNLFLSYIYRSTALLFHGLYIILPILITFSLTGMFKSVFELIRLGPLTLVVMSMVLLTLFTKTFVQDRIKNLRRWCINTYYNVFAIAFICLTALSFVVYGDIFVILSTVVIVGRGISGFVMLYVLSKDKKFSVNFLIGLVMLVFSVIILVSYESGFLIGVKWIKIYTLFVCLEAVFFTVSILEVFKEFDTINTQLYDSSVRDKLTGLFNRLYLDSLVGDSYTIIEDDGDEISMFMYDIDFFKKINDAYGHAVGDVVLQELVSVVAEELYEGDISFRWGGEEFLTILPNTNLANAIIISERVRVKVEKHSFKNVGHLTISIGVIQLYPDEVFVESYERVDKALYAAKTRGRNCCHASFSSHFKEKMLDKPLMEAAFFPIGNIVIDNEHRELIKILDDMRSGKRVNSEELLRKLVVHEHNEEVYLKEYFSQSELCDLFRRHEDMIVSLQTIIGDYEKKMISDQRVLSEKLVDVIINHIIKDDMRYFDEHLKRKSIAII